MDKQLQTFLLSLLTPGIGYLQTGNPASFYKTIALFFGTITGGALSRLFTGFWGLVSIIVTLITIYLYAAVQATRKVKSSNVKSRTSGFLKLCFTLSFILLTGLSFANRRTLMGFDVMSMGVPVMQPTLLQGDRFLVNTWMYKKTLPGRGAVIVHSFSGQQGLYVNRIIAIEGDKVEISNGHVFLNGQVVSEPYVLWANVTRQQSRVMKALVVPKGHYFVMGDNRDASFGDSRFSGTITMDNIVGKITDIIYSDMMARIGSTL